MKSALWTFVLVLGLGWMTCSTAEPTGSHGIWIDPPGWIGQCFVCPDNVTSDCMDAEPIYIEIEHDRRDRTIHVTQLYPDAWSEETGLQYHGTLSLTVVPNQPDETMSVLAIHWLREDGFGVQIVRQIRLRDSMVDGWSQVEIVPVHDSFTCHLAKPARRPASRRRPTPMPKTARPS